MAQVDLLSHKQSEREIRHHVASTSASTASHKTADKMEPRFSLPSATPRSSRMELVIGGLQIYVYGLEDLKRKAGVEVAVLYLAHNRTRTYVVTEGIAHEVLHQYRTDGKKKRVELIAVTMNMRNHGDREVCAKSNRTWEDGNENHGIDLLSLISGSAQDFKLILDYLPAYFPQFTRFHNIMAGVSLGGHTAWRLASLAACQIDAFVMVVGCPNLTALLLNRLRVDPAALNTTMDELYKVSYDRLEKVMNEQQRRRWPRAVAKLVSEGDRKVYEEYPAHVPVLICNGKQDQLVPALFTASWVEKTLRKTRMRREGLMEFFTQENTGHSCTKEMVAMIAVWLGNLFESSECRASI